ncbi:ribose-5-phosphate isomerase A, partial [Staphylococcus haemolyticus]|uniref:ribose-5-phosphate isomerase A n=1 Tax=Staphylococcus haemolyticus TaxID=1283 RepID=UPI00164287AD
LFQQKIIHQIAHHFLLLADETNLVNYLRQTFKLPLHLHNFNSFHIPKKIQPYDDIITQRRMSNDLPFITHNGN